MDVCGFSIHFLSYLPFVLELVFFNVLHVAQGQSGTINHLSQIRYNFGKTEKGLTPKPSAPEKTDPERPREKINEFTREATLALEFIQNITNYPQVRYEKCKYFRSAITLENFNIRFSKSNYFQSYWSYAHQTVVIANTLTGLFFTDKNLDIRYLNDSQIPMLYALWKYTILNNTKIIGGGIAFDTNFFPYVAKTNAGTVSVFQNLYGKFNYTEGEFYSFPASRNYSSLWKSHSSQSSSANTTAYVGVADGYWTDPYFDCGNLDRWVVTYSVPFFKPGQGSPEYSGVVMIDIDLNKSDVNQCAQDNSIFSNTDKCQPETTKCQFIPGGGFAQGQYNCICRQGFYFPDQNSSEKFFPGIELENTYLQSLHNNSNFSGANFQCLPCLQGCDDCVDDSPCMAQFNILLRGIPLGIQSFCITVTIVIGVAVLRLRKSKVMVSGMWILLEVILIGAVFLYATIIIQYFEPTTTICIMIPWFREVGFAIVYGALILKVYRLLAEFQSRKAHRVHVRDKDLMKYLCCVIIVVLGYMSAWTTVTYDHLREGKTIVHTGITPGDNLKYLVCKAGWWEYVVEVAEVLFLCFGIYLCYRVRSAPSDYSEGTYISAAICYETVISIVFYVLRHVYLMSLHPDYLFLMSFVRCQLTVTVTLLLVFGPKLLYAHRPPDDHHIRNRAFSSSDVPENMAPETMKLNVGVSSNGDVDVGEISLADMDPEDIRMELKRLYTQLQVYKTRIMRKDNPHIVKRKKQTHRRFSLQPFHHKKHHSHHDHEHEVSKTPEESTNSAEGVSVAFEGVSMNKCDDLHDNKENKKEQCTVTFKMNLK